VREEFVRLNVEVLKRRCVDSTATIADLCHDWGLANAVQEALWVVALDAALNVRSVTEVAKGSYNMVQVSIPAVLSAVLMSGTDRFALVHNHPAGDVTPTALDRNLTAIVRGAAETTGLYFEDHIIVGPAGGYYSMAARDRITPGSYRNLLDGIHAGISTSHNPTDRQDP
jgi:DNA repair protein RadC